MSKFKISKEDAVLLEQLLSSDAYDYIIEHHQDIFCPGCAEVYTFGLPMYYFVAYRDLPIRYIVIHWGETDPITYESAPDEITVHFADGTIAQWESTVFDSFITQFGIAISEDGTKLFAQTWENGLHCLDPHTGKRIWRTKSRAGITNIYVNRDTICAHKHEKALQLLDIHTGELLKEKKPATAWGFHSVDHTRILCQVTARKWEVIDATTLETLDTFPVSDRESVRSYTNNPYGTRKP